MALCVDEKTQIQALDRTQPLLAMGLGYKGVTHDTIRHGITTLFAALDVATDSRTVWGPESMAGTDAPRLT